MILNNFLAVRSKFVHIIDGFIAESHQKHHLHISKPRIVSTLLPQTLAVDLFETRNIAHDIPQT